MSKRARYEQLPVIETTTSTSSVEIPEEDADTQVSTESDPFTVLGVPFVHVMRYCGLRAEPLPESHLTESVVRVLRTTKEADRGWIMSLDLSLTSPGISVINTATSHICSYYFGPRKRLPVMDYIGHGLTVQQVSEQMPDATRDPTGYARIQLICRVIRTILHKVMSHDKPISCVYIESCYFSDKTPSAMKLAELHGAVKFLLYSSGVPFEMVGPLAVKRFWTGDGKSTKSDMYQAWRMLGFPCIAQRLRKSAHVPNMSEYVPYLLDAPHTASPVEDVVDSVALLLFGCHTSAMAASHNDHIKQLSQVTKQMNQH